MNKILLLIGIVATMGICGCAVGRNDGLAADAPTVLVTPNEFIAEFKDNPVRAKDRYTKNRVWMTGTVRSIDDDLGDGNLSLSFEADDYVTWNFLASKMREKIGKVSPRTTVTVEGIFEKELDISDITAISGIRKRSFIFKGVDLH